MDIKIGLLVKNMIDLVKVNLCTNFFLNVGPHQEDIFSTTFYGLYFSHDYTCYKTIMFGRVTRPRRRCKARALSVKLYSLTLLRVHVHSYAHGLVFQHINHMPERQRKLYSNKISLPCQDSNPRPLWYQASTLLIELPCLGIYTNSQIFT